MYKLAAAAGIQSHYVILKMLSKKIISGRCLEFLAAAAMTFHLLPAHAKVFLLFFYNAIYFLHSMTSRVAI
jgi:hypothetical protein